VVAVGPITSAACHVRTFVDDPAFACAAILGDSALCVGCRRCELTCSALHHPGLVWPEQALLGVDARAEERRFIDGLWFADACHECPSTLDPRGEEAPPPCIAACPTGAIHVATLGEAGRLRLRIVEATLCDGCGDCVPACPYGSVRLDPETSVAAICDLCADRPEGPACVAACPSSALRYYEPWRHRPGRPFPWVEGNS
jgi:Fe-S-cluster-containing hydrogenase component 2